MPVPNLVLLTVVVTIVAGACLVFWQRSLNRRLMELTDVDTELDHAIRRQLAIFGTASATGQSELATIAAAVVKKMECGCSVAWVKKATGEALGCARHTHPLAHLTEDQARR